jgi:CheY-like chemotaxis protein
VLLFVDDDSIQNLLNTKLMEFCGIPNPKKTFTDPLEAMAFIQLNPNNIECLFLDLNMPEINGWQFLERMNAELRMPVFILTSSMNSDDQAKANDFSVVKEFISKPLTSSKIEELKMKYCSEN